MVHASFSKLTKCLVIVSMVFCVLFFAGCSKDNDDGKNNGGGKEKQMFIAVYNQTDETIEVQIDGVLMDNTVPANGTLNFPINTKDGASARGDIWIQLGVRVLGAIKDWIVKDVVPDIVPVLLNFDGNKLEVDNNDNDDIFRQCVGTWKGYNPGTTFDFFVIVNPDFTGVERGKSGEYEYTNRFTWEYNNGIIKAYGTGIGDLTSTYKGGNTMVLSDTFNNKVTMTKVK